MKTPQPLISIIVPIYNMERYLEKCIKSIVHQVYTNLEIILIDDGSFDKSSEICDEWAKKDKRITVIHKENGGVSSARNIGLKAATGKYISFVDPDDSVSIYLYDEIVKHLDNKTEMLCFGYATVKDDIFREYQLNNKTLDAKDSFNYLFCNSAFNGYAWNKIYKSDIIKRNCLAFNEAYAFCEDTLFVFQYLKCVSSVELINGSYYYYLQRNDSITGKRNLENYSKALDITDILLENSSEDDKAIICTWITTFWIGIINNSFLQNRNKDFIPKVRKQIKKYYHIVRSSDTISTINKIQLFFICYFYSIYNIYLILKK